MNKIKKNFSYLFIFCWIFLWASINTSPGEIYFYGKSYAQNINATRILFALLASTLVSIYFICVFLTGKIKIKKIELFLFLFFFSQIVGLFFNKEKIFNIENLYLVILAVGTICLIILCNHYETKDFIKYFFYISISFLAFSLIFALLGKFHELINLNFYKIYAEHDLNLLGQPNPRITGISRMLAIINLFLILYFFKLKNFYYKIFLLIVLILFSILLLFMQSRGTLLCYFFSIVVIIFFLIRNYNTFRVKYFLILITLPILLYFFLNTFSFKKNFPIENSTKIDNRILTTTTSGRYEIWYYTIKNYKYKNFFGYGPNGDRFFLKNFDDKKIFGDNTSNIFLHSLVSGGIPAVFFLIFIFFEILKVFVRSKKKFFSYRNSLCLNFSIACLTFFFIRSFFENSFGLFSIDFLITYLSISYIINSTKKSQIT
jgi:O-antigen ligase